VTPPPIRKVAATGAGFWSITRVIALTARASPGGQRGSQRHRNDRGVLGAIRHVDGDETGAILKIASVEDVAGEFWPRIRLALRRTAGSSSCPRSPGQEPPPAAPACLVALFDRSPHVCIASNVMSHSHSNSAKAAVALRALYSANSSQRDFSEAPAVAAAAASGVPAAIRARQSCARRSR